MHPAHGERIVRTNGAVGAPTLSILAPFHRHDPSPLLHALSGIAGARAIEIILLDDGSADAALLSRVLVAAQPLDATLIVWGKNRGRSAARNRLVEAARGRHVLFLDADMVPLRAEFLESWLNLIACEDPPAAFGGFTVAKSAPRTRALHRFVAAQSDCLSAHERMRDSAQFTATSNLLVRRDVLDQTPFDAGFVGWGWEDVDWALRATELAPILHIDNPALHTGLDDIETLLRKFREGGKNYARLALKHPRAITRFRSFHAARAMKRAAKTPLFRRACAWLARDPMGIAPMPARALALKLYRTAIYAAHLP